MPQIAAQYPGDLRGIFGASSLLPGQMASTQFQQAKEAQDLNEKQALQDYLFNEQENPLKLKRSQADLDQMSAQLPGFQADSRLKNTQANIASAGEADKIALNAKQHATQIREEDVKQYLALGQQLIAAADNMDSGGALGTSLGLPPELQGKSSKELRQLGQNIFDHSNAVMTEKSKQKAETERMIAVADAQGGWQQKLEQMRIDAGKYNKRNLERQSMLEKLLLSGQWDKVSSAYDNMAQDAQASGDQESAQFYVQKSKEYADKYLQARKPLDPNAVNIGATTGGGVQTNPMPSTAPPLQRNPVENKPQHSLSDVQKMYPGIPAEVIRQKYKEKFGVDLQ